MLLHVLAAIHNTTTLLFGIFLSAFFLGVRQNKSNTIILWQRVPSICCHSLLSVKLLPCRSTLCSYIFRSLCF